MARSYLIRLLLWAFIVIVFGWLLLTWFLDGFPRSTMTPARTKPVALPSSTIDVWVNMPLYFLRTNWIFLLEILVLMACAWGRVGSLLGVRDLIFPQSGRARFVTGLILGLLFCNIWFTIYITSMDTLPWTPSILWTIYPVGSTFSEIAPEAIPVRQAGAFLLVTWLPSLLLLYLHALLNPSQSHGACHRPFFGAGLFAAVLLAIASVLFGWNILTDEMLSGSWRDYYSLTPGVKDGRIAPDQFPLHLLATTGTLAPFFLLLLWSYFAYLGKVSSPIWVICLLLWLFNSTIGFISFHYSGLQYLLAALIVGILLFSNSKHPYKLSFPGLEKETEAARSRDKNMIRLSHEQSPVKPLLATEELLRNFCHRWQNQHGPSTKPKLIVIATSGGGIRAAVWTGAVLEGLDAQIGAAAPLGVGTFGEHIRFITGASGGMVGAGLYAAHRIHPTRGPSLTHRLAEDSLWPTLQTMILHDLPGSLMPFYRDWDRARSLEQAWQRNTPGVNDPSKSPFQTTFAELREAESAGIVPSLVFCPVLVEDGRRLLVSNLDLSSLTTEHAVMACPQCDVESRYNTAILSRPALEMFRLFPESQDQFTVGTAARMSATFPYVSPGVSLPTLPARRVVDAGYFDNFGVNLASLWLYRHREAIQRYCGGVALIEVRAFEVENEKRHLPTSHLDSILGSVLRGLSTPAEALASVQSAGVYYRNDQLIGILHDVFNTDQNAKIPYFLVTNFECTFDAAMSWTLASWDRDAIIQGFAAGERGISQRVAAVREWFGNGGA